VIADGLGCDRHHVLPGRVAGGEFENEIDVVSLDRDRHIDQLAVSRGFLGHFAKRVELIDHPDEKVSSFL